MENKTITFSDRLVENITKYKELFSKNALLKKCDPWLYSALEEVVSSKNLSNVRTFYDEIAYFESYIKPIWPILNIEELGVLGNEFAGTKNWKSFKEFVKDKTNDESDDGQLYNLIRECMAVVKKKKPISGFSYIYSVLDDKSKYINIRANHIFTLLQRLYPEDFKTITYKGRYYLYNPSNSKSVDYKDLIQLGYFDEYVDNPRGILLSILLGYSLEDTLYNEGNYGVFNSLLENKNTSSAMTEYFDDEIKKVDETDPRFVYFAHVKTLDSLSNPANKEYVDSIKMEYTEAEKELESMIKQMRKDVISNQVRNSSPRREDKNGKNGRMSPILLSRVSSIDPISPKRSSPLKLSPEKTEDDEGDNFNEEEIGKGGLFSLLNRKK